MRPHAQCSMRSMQGRTLNVGQCAQRKAVLNAGLYAQCRAARSMQGRTLCCRAVRSMQGFVQCKPVRSMRSRAHHALPYAQWKGRAFMEELHA